MSNQKVPSNGFAVPEIRIKDAWLLRQNASQYLHQLWAGENQPLADDEWMKQQVESYKKEWMKYEDTILNALATTTGLKFRKNIIDVYIAPWFGAFSDPLVIGVMNEPDQFVDRLTHELIHILLTDNQYGSIDSTNMQLGEMLKKSYGSKHSFDTLIHIPVHALHEYIYMNVFKDPTRKNRDVQECRDNNSVDYVASWEYVQIHGYDNIINKLRQMYLTII